jgi:amidase
MDPVYFQSAAEMARRIRMRETTSLEVVALHIERIKKYNRHINAVVTLCEDEAIAAAQAADEKLKSGGQLGKLHGVPLLIKDSYRVRGIRSTFGGLPQFYNHIPKSDCEQVRRLRDAGAIILGRTNLPLLAFDWQSRNPLFKEAKNPFDFSRTPGGSSGGAAAAVAAGFAPLDLGSDLGGSTRYPSHCCGVYGLRTTDGLLPIHDLGPENEKQAFERLVTCGPIARNLADVRLMLEVLCSKHPSLHEVNSHNKKKLQIAVSKGLLGIRADQETEKVMDHLVHNLHTDGHEINETETPKTDFADAYRVHGTIAGHEFARVLPWILRTKIGNFLFTGYLLRIKLGNGPFTKWIAKGIGSSRSEYQSALKELEEIRKRTDGFFEKFDLWILPISPSVAIKRQRFGFPIQFRGRKISYSEFLGSYLVPTATLGTPALALPIKRDTGLPIALQIHGKRFSDFELLDIIEHHLDKYAQASSKNFS